MLSFTASDWNGTQQAMYVQEYVLVCKVQGSGRHVSTVWQVPRHGVIIRRCGSMSPSLMQGARGISGQLGNN